MTQEAELGTLSPNEVTIEKLHIVWIQWTKANMPWNEICVKVIEVFGLPGDRYTSHPSSHYMAFKFKSKKDFILCEILLSEYMVK